MLGIWISFCSITLSFSYKNVPWTASGRVLAPTELCFVTYNRCLRWYSNVPDMLKKGVLTIGKSSNLWLMGGSLLHNAMVWYWRRHLARHNFRLLRLSKNIRYFSSSVNHQSCSSGWFWFSFRLIILIIFWINDFFCVVFCLFLLAPVVQSPSSFCLWT